MPARDTILFTTALHIAGVLLLRMFGDPLRRVSCPYIIVKLSSQWLNARVSGYLLFVR
jgi:hypothetical protein